MTGATVVVGAALGVDDAGAMNVRVVVVDAEPEAVVTEPAEATTVVEGAGVVAATADVVGAARVVADSVGDALVESLGPQATANAPSNNVATTEVTLRTSTSGGSAVPKRVWGCERRIATPVVVGRIVPQVSSRKPMWISWTG